MIRRTSRSLRVLGAFMAALVALPAALAVSATSASASELPKAISVETRVTPSTPMWVLDFVFTFDAPVDCSAGNLELHFRISRNKNGVPDAGTTGKTPACNDDGLAPNQVLLHFDLLADDADAYMPSRYQPILDLAGTQIGQTFVPSTVWVRAALHPSGSAQDPLDIGNPIGYPSKPNLLPTAPVWIGTGDGYSSQLVQTPDTCITTTSPVCFAPNDRNSSWINKAAEDINFARPSANNANGAWALQTVVIAKDGATSSDVATGQQNADLKAELNRRTIQRPGNPFGTLSSWNWVSVSAGLVDVGIPQVMRDYSATPTGAPGGRFPYNVASNPVPWNVTNDDQCPNLGGVDGTTGVLGAINGAAGNAIKPNLEAMVDSAQAIDPSVHIVQVLYPWLTESANVCASDHDGLASNRTVMRRLKEQTDITGAPDDNIVAIDLQDPVLGFGDIPTGVPPLRENPRLWLTRPYGYPYPSRFGANGIGAAAATLVADAAEDVLPPEVYGEPIDPAVPSEGDQWWRGPVRIQWHANDPSGLDETPLEDGTLRGPWKPQGPITTVNDEGSVTYFSPYEACDILNRCAFGTLTLPIDNTAPRASVSADRDPDHNGWYNAAGGDVIVTWEGDDAKLDENGDYVVDADGNPISVSGADMHPERFPQPQILSTSGANLLVSPTSPTVCDLVGHCIPAPTITLNIDRIYPTATPMPTSASPVTASGWYRTPVTVSWITADEGGSGVDPDPLVTKTPGGTVSSGEQTFTATVCDKAGNCAQKKFTAKVDQQAPTVNFVTTAVAGNLYPAADLPAVSCNGSDQAILSDWDSCAVTISKGPVERNGRSVWTYTATGRDNAGNTATKTFSIIVSGQNYDETPPVITVPPSPFKVKLGSTTPYPVTAVDAEDGAVPWTCSPTPENLPVGHTTVTCSASDRAGNTATKTFVALVDDTPPVITVPITFGVIEGSTVKYPASAVDEIDGVVAVSCTPASNTLPVGRSTVTCTATDSSGNKATATFTAIVGAKIGATSFVVGDLSCAVGTRGYFWGSQWENHNEQSKSIRHDAFKGYANSIDLANKRWSTRPGNSSKPPDSVPEYLTVIVTDDVKKSGSEVGGAIVGYVIVKVDTNYWRAPGHIGNGDIVARIDI